MVEKYIARKNGKFKQKSFTTTSVGAEDAGKPVALGADGRLSETLLPPGIGEVLISVQIADAVSLAAGQFAHIANVGGASRLYAADNTADRPADCFVVAVDGQNGLVKLLGAVNGNLSGLTLGQDYWLGTNGGVIATPLDEEDDDNEGYISQYLGTALSATELATGSYPPVTL
jgi:hypothetical protein